MALLNAVKKIIDPTVRGRPYRVLRKVWENSKKNPQTNNTNDQFNLSANSRLTCLHYNPDVVQKSI